MIAVRGDDRIAREFDGDVTDGWRCSEVWSVGSVIVPKKASRAGRAKVKYSASILAIVFGRTRLAARLIATLAVDGNLVSTSMSPAPQKAKRKMRDGTSTGKSRNLELLNEV